MSGHHIMPFATNLKVFIGLLCLTVLTVYTAKFVDLGGNWNLALAMFIASIKGSLVLLWFMHLKGDSKTNQVVIGSTVIFLALLFGISIADIFYR
jgi:cytochrome c oxidase subunit 4